MVMCGYKGGAVMGKRRPSGDRMVRNREDGDGKVEPLVGIIITESQYINMSSRKL